MSKVILKRSSVPNKVPQVSDLEYGELAINYADGIAYFKRANNTIGTIGGVEGISAQVLLDYIKQVDGSGSGLDSDLLDGENGSYYLDFTNTTNKPDPTITLGGDLSGNVTLTDLSSGTLNATLAASGVIADTYGDATNIPQITVDAKGRITSVTDVAVSIPSGSLDFTGDVTGTGSTGSSTSLTLSDIGASGTYTKVTTDAKGRVTSGSALSAIDIPNLDASKITSGTLDAARLPSYVDDVLEYADLSSFPATGESGKIYVALDTNKTYRWSGSTYIYITSGAVDSVAGKTGVVTLVKGDVGLSNVDNTADADKNVLSATKLTTARTINGISFDGTQNIAINSFDTPTITGLSKFSGNVLVGTTTDYASTISAGVAAITGYGIYPFIDSLSTVNTTIKSSLLLAPSATITNSATSQINPLVIAPQLTYNSSGLTSSNTGILIQPNIVSSSSTSRIAFTGLQINATRANAADVSTVTVGSLTGINSNANTTGSLPATTVVNLTGGTFYATGSAGKVIGAAGLASNSSITVGSTGNTSINSISSAQFSTYLSYNSSTNASTTAANVGHLKLNAVNVSLGGNANDTGSLTVSKLYNIYSDSINISNYIPGTINIIDAYGAYIGGVALYNSTGTLNVTNSYALYLAANNYTGGSATAANITNNYGIYQVDTLSTNYFAGSITSASTISALDFNSTSDPKLKQKVGPAPGLELVNQINSWEFIWKESGDTSYGVMADEFEDLCPELVEEVDGIKTVKYIPIIAMLVKSVQQLSSRLEELERNV